MTIEETLMEVVRTLPPEKQKELLDHANRLREEPNATKPFKSIKGLWAGLGISISEEDIAEARREMWGNFPRDDI